MNVSRKDIYSFVATLLTSVSSNIYRSEAPTGLNSSSITNGFIVLRMGELRDNSEFDMQTYGNVRMYVECYVPTVKIADAIGVMNTSRFEAMQKAVDDIINAECAKRNQTYQIMRDSILSTDDFFTNNTNSFNVYITSFIITI